MKDKPDSIYAYMGSLIYSEKDLPHTVEYVRADLFWAAGWVSVEDKLPNPGDDVWASDGLVVEQGFRSHADDDPCDWCDFYFMVKYWMPLPTPQPPEPK